LLLTILRQSKEIRRRLQCLFHSSALFATFCSWGRFTMDRKMLLWLDILDPFAPLFEAIEFYILVGYYFCPLQLNSTLEFRIFSFGIIIYVIRHNSTFRDMAYIKIMAYFLIVLALFPQIF
jgi:hypothetical protein